MSQHSAATGNFIYFWAEGVFAEQRKRYINLMLAQQYSKSGLKSATVKNSELMYQLSLWHWPVLSRTRSCTQQSSDSSETRVSLCLSEILLIVTESFHAIWPAIIFYNHVR